MSPMREEHCPDTWRTASHYMDGLGWWVGGDMECYSERDHANSEKNVFSFKKKFTEIPK